jgi:hypothetical protein
MEIKIRIKTPKGCAKKTEGKLRMFLSGGYKPREIYTNEDDDELIWVFEGSVRKVMEINRNVSIFDSVIHKIFDNKMLLRTLDKKDVPELKDMLLNHTTVEVLKTATLEEMDEDGKSFWTRVKERFTLNKSI